MDSFTFLLLSSVICCKISKHLFFSIFNAVDAPVVKTYGQPKTSVKDHVNSKRQVFLRIKDQGSISFDISSSHPTHTIAECMAALVPRSNEFEKLNKNWEIKLKKKYRTGQKR